MDSTAKRVSPANDPPASPLRDAKRFVFPLTGLWVLLYGSFSLLKPPLLDGADGVYAEAAREMLVRHDWVTPYANGVPLSGAAPLLDWVTAISFSLFGSSDWAARLPLALAVLALLIVSFSFSRRLFHSPIAGFYAGLVLLTAGGIFFFAHILVPDVLLCLWTTLALYCFWRSLGEPTPSLATALGFAASCALAFLTEGLAGFLLPILTVVLYLALRRNLRHLLRWHPLPGALLCVALALPWPLVESHRGHLPPPHLWVSHLTPTYGHFPLPLFWLLPILLLLPWSLFGVRAIFTPAPADTSGNRPVSLLTLWTILAILFFTFSHRAGHDALSAIVPLALLAAGWLTRDEAEAGTSSAARLIAWTILVCGLALAGLAASFAFAAPGLPHSYVDIATLLRFPPGQDILSASPWRELTLRSMGAVRLPLLITALALAVGVLANLWLRLHRRARLANCFLAGMLVAVLVAEHLALNTFSPVLSSETLAEAIHPELHPSDIIVLNGSFERGATLAFYLEQQVQILDTRPDDPRRPGETDPAAPLAQLWTGPNRVFLWTTPQTLPTLPAPHYLIGQSGGKEIVSNQPNTGGASF